MYKRFALSGLILAALTAQAGAADAARCLSPDERRVAVAGHKMVSLAKAIRAVKARYPGDVVRVRLCEQGRRYLYVLTVLPRSGKVVHASVDAATGVVGDGS